MAAKVGEKAPEFSLKSNLDKEISLADYTGKNIVLVFYPLDFSPVCSIQLPEYSNRKVDFEKNDAVVLGVNRDSVYTHKAWATEYGIDIPLLADMNGATADAYGVYLDAAGISKRAVFIINKDGVLSFAHIEDSPGDFTLPADKLIEELAKL